MKNHFLRRAMLLLAAMPILATAQDATCKPSGDDSDLKSLYEIVSKHEQKSKALNLFINFSGGYQVLNDSRESGWSSRLHNRSLSLEMSGWVTDNIYYRLRHHLNRPNDIPGYDGFGKATDYMMVRWRFNDHWAIEVGKKCQALGAFEFDENPLYVYQYSDIEYNLDSPQAAINLVYNVNPDHQFTAEVSNTYSGKFEKEFGENAWLTTGRYVDDATSGEKKLEMELLEKINHPLTYAVGWNGSFFDGLLENHWSYMHRAQAKHKYSRFVRLGQKLNFSRLQWYVDYNMTYDDLDRMKIASGEIRDVMSSPEENVYLGKVRYQGIVSKMNWQFASAWNLVLKGTYETASVTKSKKKKNYRKAYGYVGSVEYYPAMKQKQDLRLFLSYMGRKYQYNKASQLVDYNTNCVEIGLMYRMKIY